MSRRPFGRNEDGTVDELAVSSVEQAVQFVSEGVMTLRDAADWVYANCGKKISHAGIRRRVNGEKASTSETA